MSNDYFKFKQFTVWHDKCAMKVGTDGVLLGAWSNVKNAKRILDIGTGTGLVALMMAQRSSAEITALDIDKEAVIQANENVSISPWKERITVVGTDLCTYFPEVGFDVIVSNPPYFSYSLLSPVEQRTLARHNISLSYCDLFKGVSRLLIEPGNFTVIIPAGVVGEIKRIASDFQLYPQQQLNVITAPGKSPKRSLIRFGRHPEINYPVEEMLIEKQRHQYSPEFISLVKDYYLNM